MKTLSKPKLDSAVPLKPLEMNAIHFGGIHTPLTPEKMKSIADKK